jgi:hypothetical protein
MHKLNNKNQESFDKALAHGINLTELRKEYGIRFALNFFKRVYKDSMKKNNPYIHIIAPKKYSYEKNEWHKYCQLLERCGFKFDKKGEDFLDEDTGKIVEIEVWKLLSLN